MVKKPEFQWKVEKLINFCRWPVWGQEKGARVKLRVQVLKRMDGHTRAVRGDYSNHDPTRFLNN